MTELAAVAPADGVWAQVIGQPTVVAELRAAVAHPAAMTHAWLFTGPPGSGRSNVAMAFAAALQCRQGGCGECSDCRSVLAGSHPDVSVTRSETSTLYIKEIRELVQRSALAPSHRRWQVMKIQDADRIGDPDHDRGTGKAQLKANQEPTPKTVWLLCAPTVRDVLPTIRSRCRTLTLATPGTSDVATFLTRNDGVPETVASFAARASQGHIGRARALALDERTRTRRREVVSIPARLTSLGSCMTAATNLAELAKEETEAITAEANTAEVAELQTIFGSERKDTASRAYRAALSDLERLQ
jgi:DNA polymerase-3 subunit delta'